MALLFMDSFDHYVTADFAAKWTGLTSNSGSYTISAGNGRAGTASFRGGTLNNSISQHGYLAKTLAPVDPTTFIVGVRYRMSGVPDTLASIFAFQDAGTDQISIAITNAGAVRVLRGATNGTALGTTAAAIANNTYVYLEVKVLIHPSAGTVDVRLNGISALSLTGQNTRATANAAWSNFRLGVNVHASHGWNVGSVDFDDLYVLDGSGAAPQNNFLGDCRCDPRLVTAAGATTGWTPSTGANWQNVDDAAPNGDTDYNLAASVGLTDTFVVQDAPVAGATIYGVQHGLNMKKLDAGACTVAPVVRHSGVDYVGADLAPGLAYAYGLQIAQVNPGTGAQWTEAGFNAAEFGYKKTA